MKYSVYQHWDPLKVCIVGRSYSPAFYSFIENPKARSVMERIARETEEDYQKLITLLETFGVEILRPTVSDDYTDYLNDGKILSPPMTPRDYSIMVGDNFYFQTNNLLNTSNTMWDQIKGTDWPATPPSSMEEFNSLPKEIKQEFYSIMNSGVWDWGNVLKKIKKHANVFYKFDRGMPNFSAAMTTRIGKDLYFGTEEGSNSSELVQKVKNFHPEYRCHIVDTKGHTDGTFCPVVPGLIVSLQDIHTYAETFPGWEVVYLPDQSWRKVKPFLDLKEKNKGKWWVPGEELNDEFTDFVETWLGHWVGYVEETVFDINMLVIDRHNVVCNNYNKEVFEAFERHGITPHIINFRHRYFWDGGLHCITSDVHREGVMENYFPERG